MVARNSQTIEVLSVLVGLLSMTVLIKHSEAGSIFSCNDESGTLIFQDTPCTAEESEEISAEDSSYPITAYSTEESVYRSIALGIERPEISSSGSKKQNAKAIAAMRHEERSICGTDYYGLSESELDRRAEIAKAQGDSYGGKKDRAEISCHRRYIAESNGTKSGRGDTAKRENSQSQPLKLANDPQWLIDTTSGRAMPRTGAGYTDPTTGTFYTDVGAGVVNTRTGEFIPTHQ